MHYVQFRNQMTNANDEDLMALAKDLFGANSGIVGAGSYEVVQNSPTGMSVLINDGIAYNYSSTLGYHMRSILDTFAVTAAKAVLTIDSNSSGSTRIDLICIRIDTAAIADANASNIATLVVVKGTPGAGAPATPANYHKIAEVTVADGETTITTAEITDSRSLIMIQSEAVPPAASFWAEVPGTPTRVSDTQFTITDVGNANKYDLLFKKGVVLKWLETTTFQTGMVVSSSYSSDVVTVNLIGDSLTAGFTEMKYAIQKALKETFIIPGTMVVDTDISKTFYPEADIYLIGADVRVKSAGTTNPTVFDINDDGTTRFTTKPSIASAALTDLDNVADTPSTVVAANSLVTVDVDSISTTPPVEAYIDLFYYPADWRYR